MQNKSMSVGKLNVFWDLDGVIFKYNAKDYFGVDPAYEKPGYFRYRDGDARACLIFTDMFHNENISALNILSRGATRLSKDKQDAIVIDKTECVKERFPWLDASHIFVTHDSKVESAEWILKRKLCETDILIDDYNENLIMWRNAGGTAIKYINGINSADSYSGPKIINFMIVDIPDNQTDMFEKLDTSCLRTV